jgi:dynein heavy chain
VILEKTNSAYYSCFKNLFKNIVISLAEAKDICLYLKPLKKHISLVEETDFSECIPVLAPLMHVVCLIWSNSRCYDQVKIIVLLKQICNLLIQEVSR